MQLKLVHYLCPLFPLQNMRENPIHIINVSIKSADTEDDDTLVTEFSAFAQSKVSTSEESVMLVFLLYVSFFTEV